MNALPDEAQVQAWLAPLMEWLREDVFVSATLVQLALAVLAAVLAWTLARPVTACIEGLRARPWAASGVQELLARLAPLAFASAWLAAQWLLILVFRSIGFPDGLLRVTASLLSAWVLIRILAGFVRDPLFSQAVSVTVWVIAALNILGWLDVAVAVLDDIAMQFGELRLSLLVVIKAVLSLAVMLWTASVLSDVLERRIRDSVVLTPSVKVLFAKLFQIVFISLAFIAALSSVGIDLSAFAVFGGAVGVGVGFGLQKIVSNLISGIILLLDKSIKPGDVITVGDYYGAVNSLGARYVSVITRDGIEHLIPNEELITTRVENWSYSDSNIRLRAPVGIHYRSDPHRAIALCVEAALEVPRVLRDPAPVCLLRGFGDSSIDLELRFWIPDPHNGRASVISQVLLVVWDKFRENGIEIPYPQRDVHLHRVPRAED